MRKERSELKANIHTKVLFKKSSPTVGRSTIFSDSYQRFMRNIINQIKKDIYVYVTEKEMSKNDLSVETTNCILRRYIKSKLNGQSCSSAKPKQKNVTFLNSRDLNKNNKKGHARNKNNLTHINKTDPTKILIENLRNLLKNWINMNIVGDNSINHKFDRTLDSIQSTLYTKDNKGYLSTSSACDKDSSLEVTLGKTNTACSGSCQICKKKWKCVSSTKMKKLPKRRSCCISRKSHKIIKLVSTLSVPRNICKDKALTNNKDNKQNKLKTNSVICTPGTSDIKPNLISVDTKINDNSNNYSLIRGNNFMQTNVHMLRIEPKLSYEIPSISKRDDDSKILYRKSSHKYYSDKNAKYVTVVNVSQTLNITNMDSKNIMLERKNQDVFTKADQKKCMLVSRSIKTTLENESFTNVQTENHNPTSLHLLTTEQSLLPIKTNNLAPNSNLQNNEHVYQKNITDTNFKKIYGMKFHTKRRNYARIKRKKRVCDNNVKKPQNTEFIGNVEKTIKYFFESSENNKIKFNVKINICPFMTNTINTNNGMISNVTNNKYYDKSINTLSNDIRKYSKQLQTSLLSNTSTNNLSKCYQTNILNLPNRVHSQTNYFSEYKNSVTQNFSNSIDLESQTLTTQEISELKTIVKNISYVTYITEKLLHQNTIRKKGLCEKSESYKKSEDKLSIENSPQIKLEPNSTFDVNKITLEDLHSMSTSNQTKDISDILDTLNTRQMKIETEMEGTTESQATPSTKQINNENKVSTNNIHETVNKLQLIAQLNETKQKSKVNSSFEVQTDSKCKDSFAIRPIPSHSKVESKNSVTLNLTNYNTHRKIEAVTSTPTPVVVIHIKQVGLPILTQSKGIQFTTTNTKISVPGYSDQKVVRKPGNTDDTFDNIFKKSVSYEVIEEETVIRVTDMTLGKSDESGEDYSEKVKLNLPFNLPTLDQETSFYSDSSKTCEFIEENDTNKPKNENYTSDKKENNTCDIDESKNVNPSGSGDRTLQTIQEIIKAPFSADPKTMYAKVNCNRVHKCFDSEKGDDEECTKRYRKSYCKPFFWRSTLSVLCILIMVGDLVALVHYVISIKEVHDVVTLFRRIFE